MKSQEIEFSVLHQRIRAVLDTPHLHHLVAQYFSIEPQNPFAGRDFDTLGQNPPDRFVIDDLLALNLLDIKLSPAPIRRILSGEFDDLLFKISTEEDITSLDGMTYSLAEELWQQLRSVPDVGTTTTTKLLSRKRPRLIPIRDGIVRDVLGLGISDWWRPLSTAIADKDIHAAIKSLDPGIPGYTPTALRLLDVSIWMLGSGSQNAIDARKAAGSIPRSTFPIY